MGWLHCGTCKIRVPLQREAVCWLVGALAFAAWLVWGPAQIMRGVDYGLMHRFLRLHLREAFWAGEMPFWNPYTLLGRPFLADPEVAAFYPATWLFWVFPESTAFWLTIGLHFALAGWGCSRLAQSWGVQVPAATIGGVAFALSPTFLGPLHCGLLGFFCTIAWWPLLLRALDQLCEEPRARTILLLAALLAACFLAGHSHAFWLCGCSLGIYLLPRCCAGGFAASLRRAARAYGSLALAALGGLALGAIQLLPLIELTMEGNRTPGRDFSGSFSVSFAGLQSLLRPTPSDPSWLGLQLYAGLPLFILGIIQIMRLRDARMRGLFGLAVVSLVLALGQETPFFDLLYPLIPAMGFFRCNNRFATFAVWAIIVAAMGFWRRRNGEPPPLWADATLVALGLFTLATRGVALGPVWATTAAAAAGFAFYHAGRRGPRPAPGLVFGLWVVAWLVDFAPPAVALGREFQAFAPGPYTSQSRFAPAIAARMGAPRELAPSRVFLPNRVMKANSGMVNGYSFVTGYGALSSARVWNYLHVVAAVQPDNNFNTLPDPKIHDSRGSFPYRGANILASWDSAQGRLVVCPESELGTRAWLTRNITPVADHDRALEALRDGFDPRRAVLLEPEAQALAAAIQPGEPTGSAPITAFGRNHVALAVTTEAPAILVLAEAWFPGWRAEIDGVETEVFPTNVWMRGVVVPAGAHEVVFNYRPTYFGPGAALSALAFATWLAAWRQYRRTN